MAEDDLEPLVTECPSCRTRFRVAETQLQSARGRVRCGACLTVFNGVEHLIWDEVQTFASDEEAQNALDDLLSELEETASRPADQAAKPSGGTRHDHDAPAQANFVSEGLSGPEDLSAGTDELDWPDFEQVEDTQADAEAVENEQILDLIEEQVPVPDQRAVDTRRAQSPRNVVPIFSGFEEDDLPTETVAAETPPSPRRRDATSDGAEISHVTQTAAELEKISEALEEATQDLADVTQEPEADAQDLGRKVGAELDADPATRVETRATAAVSKSSAALKRSDIDAAVEAAVVFGEPSGRRPWVWLAIAAAVAGIGVQILWYQFDDWAKDPTWRPLYAGICDLVGCELPVQSDLELLRTQNLLVRSDPDNPGVLLVNAIIVNEAQFSQPFPVLELRFTNLRGALVAGRRFQPSEYLAGEASSMDLMPARTPVQIELEIEDPGADAVNYTMKIR